MTKKGFTVEVDATLIDAVKALNENECKTLVVVENSKPVGVITERDIIKKVILRRTNPEKIRVHQIMSKPFIFGNPEMELSEAARIMLIKKINYLPIVCNEYLVGIISFSEVVRCKESLEQFKVFANSATANEIKQAIDVYFSLDNMDKKCPLMIEQGYPKKCRKAECMWWIGEDCAVTVLSKTIKNSLRANPINNF